MLRARFQSVLCVDSPRIDPLYGSYAMVVPRERTRELVVFPDLLAFHDTWYHTPGRGLRAVRRQWHERGRPLLPAITRGTSGPCARPLLHLHRLEPRARHDKSRCELSDISGAIQEGLRRLGDTGPERR